MTGSGGKGSDGIQEAHVKHRQCLCFEEMLTDHSLIFADGATMLLMCVCVTTVMFTQQLKVCAF